MVKFVYKSLFFVFALFALLVAIGVILPYNKDGYIRAQKFKMDVLANPLRKPTIVILGGSNAAFGYDTKILNDSLPMPVFNAGLHAGIGMKFFLDDCSQYLKKGDVLVFSPEYDQFYGDLNDGQSEMTDAFYLYNCHYPGKMTSKQIKGVLQNTPSYLRKKIEYNVFALVHLKTDPVYSLSSVNEYGDVTWHWYNTRKHGTPGGVGMDGANPVFNEDAIDYTVGKINELKAKGVTVVMYPAAYNKEAFNHSLKSIQCITTRLKQVGLPYVCSPKECSFPKELFYDTDYHLNHEGTLVHNKHIIGVIRNVLTKRQ